MTVNVYFSGSPVHRCSRGPVSEAQHRLWKAIIARFTRGWLREWMASSHVVVRLHTGHSPISKAIARDLPDSGTLKTKHSLASPGSIVVVSTAALHAPIVRCADVAQAELCRKMGCKWRGPLPSAKTTEKTAEETAEEKTSGQCVDAPRLLMHVSPYVILGDCNPLENLLTRPIKDLCRGQDGCRCGRGSSCTVQKAPLMSGDTLMRTLSTGGISTRRRRSRGRRGDGKESKKCG